MKPRKTAPLFPRPVSPVDTRPLSPTPSDVAASDSDSEIDPEIRAAKRRRVERIAQLYLSGQQIFILSAGLKGPFDNKWMNPWEKKKKRGKLADRIAINETPKCAAAPEWGERKTDAEYEETEAAEATTHDKLAERGAAEVADKRGEALPSGDTPRGKVGVSELPLSQREPASGEGNKKPAQSFGPPLEGIPEVNMKPIPPTEAWLNTLCSPRYPSSNTLIVEARKPPDLAAGMAHLLPPHTPGRLEVTATVSVSTPTKPLGTPISTDLTPINQSVFSIQASDTGHVVIADNADGNKAKTKKRPRHIDFATMTSPSRPKHANGPDVTSKPKARSKGPSLAEDSKGEWPMGVSPSDRSKHEVALAAVQPPTTARKRQQKSVLEDATGLPRTLSPLMTAPAVVADASWPVRTSNPILSIQNNNKMRESLENTQAEILKAQRLFQSEIPSPESKSPYLPDLTPVETSFRPKTSGATALTSTEDVSAFLSFRSSRQGGNASGHSKGGSPDTDVISTQELIDAVSPLTFSTIKTKQRKGVFMKRASLIQSPSKKTSFGLDGTDGAFGMVSLDMETTPEIEESAALLLGRKERATMTAREQVTPTKAVPGSSTAARASIISPSRTSSGITIKGSTRKFDNLNNSDSEEEMDNYIEDISSYLEGWDLELELKRVAAAKPAGGPAVANKGILRWE